MRMRNVTAEATFEIVSCVIVAILLLIISYVLLVVRIFVGTVISVRLAGATFIMTGKQLNYDAAGMKSTLLGLYILFSMAFTLYQSTNMNAERALGMSSCTYGQVICKYSRVSSR